MYYMRHYEAKNDFGLPETTFNVCSFWRVDALERIGRREEVYSMKCIIDGAVRLSNHRDSAIWLQPQENPA